MVAAKLETAHVVDVRLGGERRRYEIAERAKQRAARRSLPLVADLHGFEPTLEAPPRTRGECPDTGQRPCPFVRCRHHLYRDDEPAGRPGLANVPRGPKGQTVRVEGDMANGKRSPPQLDASAWVTLKPRPSCALVVAEQVARRADLMGNNELGDLLGKHRTLIARTWQRAIRKFIAAGGTLEGLELLRQQEMERNR
jgi:hypothetical protein